MTRPTLRRTAPATLVLGLLGAVTVGAQTPTSGLTVPEQAPDTVPPGTFDTLDPEYRVPPDLLIIGFKRGTTTEAKRRILADAGATEIVGGWRSPESMMDGLYLVRFATGDDMQVLLAVMEALLELEQVVLAGLHDRVSPDRLEAYEGDGSEWSRWATRPEPRSLGRYGTRVASVMAAKGDNGSLETGWMTGMMRDARVEFRPRLAAGPE